MDSHNVPDQLYAELCESEQRYRSLVELSPAPIVVQSDDRVVFINRAGVRLLGAGAPAELIGLPVLDFVHPDYRDLAAARIRQIQEQQPLGDRIEAACIRLDGQLIDVEIVGISMTYRGKPATQMVISDITARKRMEAERLAAERRLLEAQKIESLGVLAGGIAHDYNNLLMGVLGNAALARMELPPGSPAEYSIRQIEAAASHAADLTRQMLAYSGRGRLMMQSIDVNTLVEETSALAQASFSREVTIEFHLGAALPPIEADVTQMRQLLMSLLVNAGEAIGDGPGAITISTGARQVTGAYLATTYLAPDLPSGQYVYLEVADTGRGMDAGTLARIFEPFFTTKFTGRGLGLAAALGIVRGQRGALAVQSEPGRGSVFTIWLPSAAQRQPEATAAPSERRASAGGAVLVVEDDDSLRALTMRILEHFGFAVLTAADGQDGVAAFRAQADLIDCVLLDMHMPRMDGWQALHEILRIKHDARVVLMSGQDAQEIAQHFANLNLAGILQKPFSPDTLHAQIRQAIDRHLGVEDRI